MTVTVFGLTEFYLVEQIIIRIDELIALMKSSIRRVVNEDNSIFNRTVKQFRSTIGTSIQNNTLGVDLKGLFEAYDLVGQSAYDKYLLAISLFGFNVDEELSQINTVLIDILDILYLTIRTNALALAYDNAINVDFGNQAELENAINILENEFDYAFNVGLDTPTRLSLLDLRVAAFQYFTTLTLRKILTINTNPIPSRVLAYKYYKDSSLSDNIVSLNKAYNTAFVEGEIDILSENVS